MGSRSRSRSPLNHDRSDRASPTPSGSSGTSGKYYMKISLVPISWGFRDVSNYIRQNVYSINKDIANEIGYIQLTPMNKGTQTAIVIFKTMSSRQHAFDILRTSTEKVEGKKLLVYIVDARQAQYTLRPPKSKDKHQNFGKKFVTTQYSPQDNETYGLSAQYLEDMGILERPLTSWVFVKGLPEEYKNETKLIEVFRRAGTILSANTLQSKTTSYYNARILYDHPVEAVQAVSMFNNREIMGKSIKCEMDFLKKRDFVNNVTYGPGLGPEGTPMKGVRVAMECKKVKNDVTEELRRIGESLDELKGQVTNLYMEVENIKSEQNKNSQNAPMQNTQAPNPLAALLQPLLLQTLTQSSGNDMSALGNLLQNMSGGNMNSLLQQAQSKIQNDGSNPHSVPNMQGGYNAMQSGPNNLQGGHNMQDSPSNLQDGPSNMQFGRNDMQDNPNNNQFGQNNMQGGPNNMHGGPSNMQRGANNTFGNYGNQGNPNNMHPNFQGPPNNYNNQDNSNFNQSRCNKQKNYGENSKSSDKPKKCFKCGVVGHLANKCQKGIANIKQNNQNRDQAKPEEESSMLLFKNLPPAVTQQVMVGKMREVGEVKLVEMTGPGRALVSFYYDQDASKCIRLFNNSKVDGQTIEVKRV